MVPYENRGTNLKKTSYTLAEALIIMVVMSLIIASTITILRPKDYVAETLKKSGGSSLVQISFATRQILTKYSTNFRMTRLFTPDKTIFSINDNKADEKLVLLYKKLLFVSNKTVSSDYTNSFLLNESGAKIGGGSGLKVSDFTQGFITRSGMYIAFRLYNSCSVSETYIYDPSNTGLKTATNSCGLIFYDVNADNGPNTLGIDQYIASLGAQGIK